MIGTEPSAKRILGVDYGTRRIGIAVSDPSGVIARGIKVVKNSPAAAAEIKEISDKFGVIKIIIGMPFTLKGESGRKAEEVEDFIVKLEKLVNIPVIRQDERFTSHMAHRTLREMNVKKMARRDKETIDIMAAALILQQYLDSR